MLRTETLVQCPLCDSTSLRHLLNAPDYESHTGDYGIDECVNCGVGFTNPRPIEEELPKLYEQRTTADFPRMDHGFVQRLRNFAIDRYLQSQISTDRPAAHSAFDALDFGCGDGALALGLVRYCQKHDVDARITAVDFHEVAPAALTNPVSGVRYLPFATWRGNGQRYHAIFLRHVLEHHPDPRRLLGELAAALLPRGRMFIEVPNRRSLWARIFGRAYFGYYLPRHLLHFDAGSLRTVLEQIGLTDIHVTGAHTPLIGRSLGYLSGRDIGNTGLLGLASYPLQVGLDVMFGRSTTLRASARSRG